MRPDSAPDPSPCPHFSPCRAGWIERFSIQEASFFFMGLLRDLQSGIEQRGLTGGAWESGDASIAITVDVCSNGFRQAVVDVLNKPAKTGTLLPICCRKEPGKVRKSPENAARKPLNPMKSM
jgi:hypothetical protein